MLTYHSWISWHLNHGSHMTINCKQYHVRFNIKSFSRRTRFARSRKFRILARKIEFRVFRLFRIRKKYFREKTGFWWISIFFPHMIHKSIRNSELTPKFFSELFEFTPKKNSEWSEYSKWTRKKIKNCPNTPNWPRKKIWNCPNTPN
jgi:hypothetical protein